MKNHECATDLYTDLIHGITLLKIDFVFVVVFVFFRQSSAINVWNSTRNNSNLFSLNIPNSSKCELNWKKIETKKEWTRHKWMVCGFVTGLFIVVIWFFFLIFYLWAILHDSHRTFVIMANNQVAMCIKHIAHALKLKKLRNIIANTVLAKAHNIIMRPFSDQNWPYLIGLFLILRSGDL